MAWQTGGSRGARRVFVRSFVVTVTLLAAQCQTIDEWTRAEPTPEVLCLLAAANEVLNRDSLAAYAEADALVQRALVASPKAAETNAAFAELEFRWADALRYQARGQPPQAMFYELRKRGAKCVEVARVQAPNLPAVRRALAAGALLAEPPNLTAAREALIYPGADSDVAAVFLQGKVALLEPGGARAAHAAFTRALQLEPAFLRAHYELAEMALRAVPPNTTAARTHLQAVLAKEPKHSVAAARLADIDTQAPADVLPPSGKRK